MEHTKRKSSFLPKIFTEAYRCLPKSVIAVPSFLSEAGLAGGAKELMETIFRSVFILLSFFATILLWIYGMFYGQMHPKTKAQEKAYKKFLVSANEELSDEECKPVRSKVVHEAISHPTYGWFREDTYHVPLELGFTVMSRKRALRHQHTLGSLLLIHGFSQNRFAWHTTGRSLANYLAEAGYDVFFLDLRGSRESLKLGAILPQGFHDYVEIDIRQALKVIKKQSSHKKVYLLGHSMGAGLSCAAAGKFPEIVGGVVHIAGVYGFSQHSTPFWKLLLKTLHFLNKYAFPYMPRRLMIPTREIGRILQFIPFITNSPIGEILPIQAWVIGAIETKILTRYLYQSFESSSIGVLQCLTNLAAENPFSDSEGNDYFHHFEKLQIPLLVICADKDDLVNVMDSLKCFDKSTSQDKSKLVFIADQSQNATSVFGHCDILVGTRAVTHVWEQIRLWLDDRRKLALIASAPTASEQQVEKDFEELKKTMTSTRDEPVKL